MPNGFRVQCFASSQIERVRAEQRFIESKLHYPVYIIFGVPYYKLFVGDFVKRVNANIAVGEMKGLGYVDAGAAHKGVGETVIAATRRIPCEQPVEIYNLGKQDLLSVEKGETIIKNRDKLDEFAHSVF